MTASADLPFVFLDTRNAFAPSTYLTSDISSFENHDLSTDLREGNLGIRDTMI
jgi:hypothetical protein